MVVFESWYERNRPKVFGALVAFGADAALAQEAADEAFVRAFERWGRVSKMERPDAWLFSVAFNLVRRGKRKVAMEAAMLARLGARQRDRAAPEPTDIWEVVGRLPERQRQAIALRYGADLTEPDIAIVMGVSRGTVASTLADARRRLATLMEPEKSS